MTPDITSPAIPTENAPSTSGMTAKVVKGSLWTLVGQIGPLAVSLVATPFTIRLLGVEGYGVLILIGLIPAYFGFADFGMGLAATKFASEAYAEGDLEEEARIVRTAALIALCSSLPVAVALFAFSGSIIHVFDVPEHLFGEAALGLKLAAVTFVLNFLTGVFNTPQLTRLRMDLNTAVNAGFRILGLIATPFAIYLHGVVGAIFVLMLVSFLTLLGQILISFQLNRRLFQHTVDRRLFGPMLKFGAALTLSAVAGVLLINVEKVVLAQVSSVEVLAYYSVAFNFAMLATMFSIAMIQSLVPAFSQFLTPEKKDQLNLLYKRALKINLLGTLPILTGLFVIAEPLLTMWAGSEFGVNSVLPFHILLAGLFFNITALIPYSLLMASGRTDIFAKLYWIELIPYIVLIAGLTIWLGAVGAAVAWSVRVFFDAVLLAYIAKQTVGVSYKLFATNLWGPAIALVALIGPVFVTAALGHFSVWSLPVLFFGLVVYSLVVWNKLLAADERSWFGSRLYAVISR